MDPTNCSSSSRSQQYDVYCDIPVVLLQYEIDFIIMFMATAV
jgi:hypothetical protein